MEKDKKVIVTGGAGYIGSHVCKALANSGFSPITVDDLSTGNQGAVKWGPLIEIDIRDTQVLTELLVTEQPVAVLHFAASAYVGESVEDPQKYYENNVIGSLSLLSSMARARIDTLVFSSSCATFGRPLEAKINEDHPQDPINPYGRTKLMCEQAIKDYARAGDLCFAILRYFNAAGADPDLEVGELHQPEPHIIPLAIEAAIKGNDFYLNGEDWNTLDGTPIRDYIHVTDLADGHVSALKRLLGRRESFAVNLGSGIGVSVKQVVSEVERVCNKKIKYMVRERRVGDPEYLVADISKAKILLDWRPQYSSVEYIIDTAVAWYKKLEF